MGDVVAMSSAGRTIAAATAAVFSFFMQVFYNAAYNSNKYNQYDKSTHYKSPPKMIISYQLDSTALLPVMPVSFTGLKRR